LNQVVLVAAEGGWVTVGKGKENSVSAVPQLPPSVVAPVQKGQVVAKVSVQNEGKVVKEVNLLASSDVEKSLIPPWPILLGILCGLVIVVGFGLWWVRRPKTKKFL
jgi:D-alanyl-D-alanine carboxypeptidase